MVGALHQEANMTRKILLVDDHEAVLDPIEAILKEDDGTVEVRTTTDGEEALEIAHQWKPDLIFLDVMMPRRNGYEVCLALKGDPITADIKVVILTGLDQEFDRQKALYEVGADGYISKPFNATALIEQMDVQLAHR